MKAIIWRRSPPRPRLSAAQTSALAAGEPYLIGLIAGTTGAYGSTGVATVNGAQMAVDKINASGGVLGRQFKLDPHNDDASATVSGQLYEKLIAAGRDRDRRFPRHRSGHGAACDPAQVPDHRRRRRRRSHRQHRRAERLRRTPGCSTSGSTPSPGARRSANTRSSIAPTASRSCMIRRLMVRAASMASSSPMTKPARRSAIDHAITENWSTGATTGLMPEVNAAKAAGIKCIDAWLTPQDQAAFVQDLHSAGYNATVFGNDETNADDTFSKLAGDLADGTISAVLTSDLHPSPELTAFREEYKKKLQYRSDAVRRNELRQHHDAGAGGQRREVDQAGGPAEGVQLRQGVQGHHRRSRLLGEEPHHDQRRAADAGQI